MDFYKRIALVCFTAMLTLSCAVGLATETIGDYSLMDYKEYARYPDRYDGDDVFVRGRVVQVTSGRTGDRILLATDSDGYSDLVYVYGITGLSFNILEDDDITVYGKYAGIFTYETILGAEKRVPAIEFEKIKLGWYVGVTPSPAPTNESEEGNEDDVVVGPDAPAESIRFVQERLVALEILDRADGVYGPSTLSTVRYFQNWVNSRFGAGTLEATGLCDAPTLEYLEEAYNYKLSQATSSPTATQTATPTPTIPVIALPTPTSEPTDDPVGEITDPGITITGYDSVDEGVHYVQGQVTIQWGTGDNASYHVKITDSDGKTIREGDTQGTSLSFDAATLTPGLVYEIEVTATPIGGAAEDARTSYAFFAVEASATEPPATNPPTATTLDRNSSPEAILSVQTRLYLLGYLLTSDNPSQGVFDFGTRTAIARFQEDYNLRYADDPTVAPLPVIDPSDENAIVDQETLRQLEQ